MPTDRSPTAVEISQFDAVARSAGYSAGRAHQMRIAAAKLGLPLPQASEWLEAGFTPWAAAAWARNFDSPEAAAPFRDRGLSAEEGYWRSFDERHSARSSRPGRADTSATRVDDQDPALARGGAHPPGSHASN